MSTQLAGTRVAILVTSGFEQVELVTPMAALVAAGATVYIVSPDLSSVRGWNEMAWATELNVDRHLDAASDGDYDALLLPGGVMNCDQLRTNRKAIQFVKRCYDNGKPIAAIGHALWAFIEADVVRGVMLTSCPALRTDLVNAGAEWIDQDVVVDRGIVSSRTAKDLPAFNRTLLEEFAEGRHGSSGRRRRTDTHAVDRR
jgi:protease I